MCDEFTEADNAEFLTGKLNRRSFTGLGTIAAFTAILPASACGTAETGDDGTAMTAKPDMAPVIETEVNVPMADGVFCPPG
jgi:hypothetical protein